MASTTEKSSESPSDRNKAAITEQLKTLFPKSNSGSLNIFEIGSGTGIHVRHFSTELPHVHWCPSDYNESTVQLHSGQYVQVTSILDETELDLPSNVDRPIFFDVTAPLEDSRSWATLGSRRSTFDGVLNINMLHIAPWSVSEGLFRTAGYLLKPGGTGLLVLYGSFAVDGVLEPESNREFDRKLREKCPDWGVRDVRDLKALAAENGLRHVKTVEMPSNNKILVFARQ